jgi:hypothetical protein
MLPCGSGTFPPVKQRFTLTGHSYKVVSVAFSADGRFIISQGYRRQIHRWDRYNCSWNRPARDTGKRSSRFLHQLHVVSTGGGTVAGDGQGTGHGVGNDRGG